MHFFGSHIDQPILHKSTPGHRNSGDLKQSRKCHSSGRKKWKYVKVTTSTKWRRRAVQTNSSWICKLWGRLVSNQWQFLACFLYRHGLCNSQCPSVRPSIRQTYFYLLTPRSSVLEKLTGFQLVKKFPAFYGTRMFITTFTSARHLPLTWASSIQSIPTNPTSCRSILILSSHLRLGCPSGLFLTGFPNKHHVYPSPLSHMCYMPAHRFLFDFIIRKILGEEYRSLSFLLRSFLQSPVTSSLLGPNILLTTLFSNTLSLLFSLNVKNQVPHPYKTSGKVIIPYMLIYFISNLFLEN